MSWLTPSIWLPELSPATQAFIRGVYGILLLGTLLRMLPHARRFLLSERWGGYAESTRWSDAVRNPWVCSLLLGAWIAWSLMLIVGRHTVWASLGNLLLCYYFFIWRRWGGVSRGQGALGFMTCWLAAAVFLLECTQQYLPLYRSFAVLVLQFDYALIMLSAGLSKLTSGYAANHGMEYALVNPMWGHWPRFWKRVRPGNLFFRIGNQLAWSVEIAAALLMLVPPTRYLGALLIIAGFGFIATQLRLWLLVEMVALGGALFFTQGTPGQVLLDAWSGPFRFGVNPGPDLPAWIPTVFVAGLGAYFWLLPAVRGGLYYQFVTGRPLRKPWRIILEKYSNVFGIFLWAVFTADHMSFFLRLFRQSRKQREHRVLISRYDRLGSRFRYVAESVTLTGLFNTPIFSPDRPALFGERLRRFARTLPCSPDEVLIFEYVVIRKQPDGFAYVPTIEFEVDLKADTIRERRLIENAPEPWREGIRFP